jgi:ribosome biogenesis GTPase A
MQTVQENKQESKSIVEVLEYCKAHNLPARVVGRWVWVKFESKPNVEVRQTLKDIGFRWSRRRGQWCHNCGYSSRPARNYRPWDRYKTTMIEDYVNTGLGVQNVAI